MEYNLPSIFKDEYVISFSTTYFENKKLPFICYMYKYDNPIGSSVLSYSNLVAELDIETTISDA